MEDGSLLTTAQVAEALGKPVATVNRWAASGRLTAAAQLPGRTGARLFRRADLDAFIAASERSRAAS